MSNQKETNVSDDGAHLGYGMEAALKGALGGEEPPKRMTAPEMRDYILSAPIFPQDYDDAGRAVAKAVLMFLERHPEASDMPAVSEHEWPKKADGSPDWEAQPTIIREGLYDYIKRTEPGYGDAQFAGMTGFMWGWGVNAARRCLELPPVPNPAIVTIGG
jgi:hypothetical protein